MPKLPPLTPKGITRILNVSRLHSRPGAATISIFTGIQGESRCSHAQERPSQGDIGAILKQADIDKDALA